MDIFGPLYDPTLTGVSPHVEWLAETNGHCQIPLNAALLLGGGSALGGISSLIGGGKGASAATDAARIQSQAALASAALQQQRFEEAKTELSPFIQYGQNVLPIIQGLTGTGPGGNPLTAPLTRLPDLSTAPTIPAIQPWDPTMEGLAKTPGYQFALQQGLLATQAGNAAQGWGSIGPTSRAIGPGGTRLTGEAVGLASQTYQNQFSNWLQQQQLMQTGGLNQFSRWLQQQQLGLSSQAQTFNQLTGQAGTGLSAGGALAGVGIQSGQNIGTALQQAGQATGAGVLGAAQAGIGALTGATNQVTGATNQLGNFLLAQNLGLFGSNPGGSGIDVPVEGFGGGGDIGMPGGPPLPA